MVAFEEKVRIFRRENEQMNQAFQLGSDEHLDVLLSFKRRLEKLSNDYASFMEDIIPCCNEFKVEELKSRAIPSLLDLYASSIGLVATLKRSRLANDLKNSCHAYYSQVENLRELIADLEIHRANDSGLDEILAEINIF